MKNPENEKLYRNFCDNVDKILAKMQMKRITFAKKIGMNYKAYNQKRNGKGKFNLAEMLLIAGALDEYIEDMVKADYIQ